MEQLTILAFKLGLYNFLVLGEFVALGIFAAIVEIVAPKRPLGSFFKAIARRKFLSVCLAAALPLLIRAALLPLYPVPSPAIHDEFSNVLLADTFLEGRLANPAHRFADHIETFQSLQSPTYASFRPPGPGLAIASGKWISGSDWLGIWLTTGLMCGAICWMLQGWLPPVWALCGGLLVGIQIGILSYWMNSYWGGSVAALGGAIAMGAAGRIRRRGATLGQSLTCGLGIAVLVMCRPFEGVLFSAGVGLILLDRRRLLRALLPLVIVGSALAAWTLYYNSRVTGNAGVFPYQLGVGRNNMAPSFVWDKEDANKQYSHPHLRRFHEESEMYLYRARQKVGRAWLFAINLASTWQFFVRPALTLPLLAGLALVWRSRNMRLIALPAGLMIAAMPLANWFNVHYIAGMTGIVYAFVAQGLRRMWVHQDKKGRHGQRNVVLAVPFACVATLAIATTLEITGKRMDGDLQGWAGNAAQWPERAEMARDLHNRPGEHLVFVRYDPKHDFEREWVQNEADIDAARVVWARELSPEANAALIAHYPHRRVWLLEADARELRAVPYSGFSQATVR